ncbi:Pycsar system effector family protein [Fulvivirga lutea]|uniref:HD domain-containing protein n=1 Tax=Fulvivirga lutea TaxID=2810512 RepID=A0A974WLU0_9BACT|nr:Pycsar system effector family protein [Fulvivirga lutea]QSE98600.1 HD domain-containing protein [Fulvivirga lutea]
MAQPDLLSKSKAFAEKTLSKLPQDFTYHDLKHTQEVVEAVELIAKEESVNGEELEALKIAAWFHDLGYNCDENNHEEASINLMRDKLEEWGAESKTIEQVSRLIQSTKMPQQPQDELSKIICDADLFHLSTDAFQMKSEHLREELCNVCNHQMSSNEWAQKTLSFIESHTYFTNYGKNILEPRKQENLDLLKKKINKEAKSVKKLEAKIEKLEAKLVKAKTQKPDRGIETMFRVTSKNHLQLSAMADTKANIMISINSIILSVLVSVLFRKFEDYPQLIIPALILVIVCLTTIVFAVLATRPNISSGKFTREEIREKKTNLLFFGNFHGMELDNYMWGMKEMMKDADFLYGSLIKDIYFLGIVLGKKYKMLRKSYNVFMFGFIIAIMSFVIALLLYPNSA